MADGPEVEEVSPTEANKLVREGAYLLDVREPDEWEAGHAPAAHHVALGELPERLAELPAGQVIVCVCRSGGRSARAAELIGTVTGHRSLNLAGGMRAWAAVGLPVVADGGDGEVI